MRSESKRLKPLIKSETSRKYTLIKPSEAANGVNKPTLDKEPVFH
jgi:hypothetical protein